MQEVLNADKIDFGTMILSVLLLFLYLALAGWAAPAVSQVDSTILDTSGMSVCLYSLPKLVADRFVFADTLSRTMVWLMLIASSKVR